MGICCMSQGTQMGLCINLKEWGGQGSGREVQEGGDKCTPMADSCLTENNKILLCNYPSIKKIIKKKKINRGAI